jgi:DNA-binding NarL/FixJ family response regulator
MAPSVLLMDKALGAGGVVECLQALRESSGRTAAVVWGNGLSEVESFRFLQIGAAGVLRKTASLTLIVQCLRTVASGGTWMEHDPAGSGPRLQAAQRLTLTARELQVRELVERGMKNKDIAMALGIRTGTVKIHLKHIFEKTGIRGRYGLALSGLQEKGLLSLPGLEAM